MYYFPDRAFFHGGYEHIAEMNILLFYPLRMNATDDILYGRVRGDRCIWPLALRLAVVSSTYM